MVEAVERSEAEEAIVEKVEDLASFLGILSRLANGLGGGGRRHGGEVVLREGRPRGAGSRSRVRSGGAIRFEVPAV